MTGIPPPRDMPHLSTPSSTHHPLIKTQIKHPHGESKAMCSDKKQTQRQIIRYIDKNLLEGLNGVFSSCNVQELQHGTAWSSLTNRPIVH
jgi:glutamate racemase